MKKIAAFTISLIILAGLFSNSREVTSVVVESITLCVNTIIPSLFPFMAVSLFISLCGAGDILSFILTPFTKYVLSLPTGLGQTVFFSLIGGYPTGVRLLGSLVEDGRLTERDAATLLSFCVSPGPAFVVLAVGKGMFASYNTGVILLCSQLCANILTGAYICRKFPVASHKFKCNAKSLYTSFIQASAQASSGILTIVSYVVLISALTASISFKSESKALGILLSLTEVTSGCLYASTLGGTFSVMLASFLLSFSGISVCCQIAALASEYSIPLSLFIKCRCVCGTLSALITGLLVTIFPSAAAVSSLFSETVAASSPNRTVGAVCLCIMITITFASSSLRENIDF